MQITDHTALVLIDVQQGFDDRKWGARNNPESEAGLIPLVQFSIISALGYLDLRFPNFGWREGFERCGRSWLSATNVQISSLRRRRPAQGCGSAAR